MENNQTLAIIKPHAVRNQSVGPILTRIAEAKLIVVRMRLSTFPENLVREFYQEHKGKPFFEGLVTSMCLSPCVFAVLEANEEYDCIKYWRELMGATDPRKAKKGTLRAEFGREMPDNAVHGSDSSESARREISFALHAGLCTWT